MYIKSFPRSILMTWRRLRLSFSTYRLTNSRTKSGHRPKLADSCLVCDISLTMSTQLSRISTHLLGWGQGDTHLYPLKHVPLFLFVQLRILDAIDLNIVKFLSLLFSQDISGSAFAVRAKGSPLAVVVAKDSIIRCSTHGGFLYQYALLVIGSRRGILFVMKRWMDERRCAKGSRYKSESD